MHINDFRDDGSITMDFIKNWSTFTKNETTWCHFLSTMNDWFILIHLRINTKNQERHGFASKKILFYFARDFRGKFVFQKPATATRQVGWNSMFLHVNRSFIIKRLKSFISCCQVAPSNHSGSLLSYLKNTFWAIHYIKRLYQILTTFTRIQYNNNSGKIDSFLWKWESYLSLNGSIEICSKIKRIHFDDTLIISL